MYRVLKPNEKALIIDLQRDASKKAINKSVDNMGLNWINTLFTKFTFRFGLLRNVYTIDEIKEWVSYTNFKKCEILEALEDPIGFELWLEK